MSPSRLPAFLVLCSFLVFLPILPILSRASPTADWGTGKGSPVLAGPIGEDCVKTARLSGKGKGRNVTIGGVPTYLTDPPANARPSFKNVILFFSDVMGPFFENNSLLQDYFASQGFHVLGIDYFLGDPIQNQPEGFYRYAWLTKTLKQADTLVPKWTEAVKERFGPSAKYSSTGYCFGGPYTMQAAASNTVSAAAFAHPAFLTEDHFNNVTKPLLMSIAEFDFAFPTEAQRHSVDLLAQKNATYHVQIYSGTVHGFATAANPDDANAVWAKQESARSVVAWVKRFTL